MGKKSDYIQIGNASFHKATLAKITLHAAKDMFPAPAYNPKHVERAWQQMNPPKEEKMVDQEARPKK